MRAPAELAWIANNRAVQGTTPLPPRTSRQRVRRESGTHLALCVRLRKKKRLAAPGDITIIIPTRSAH
jgi:hypothetical protein